MHRTLTLRPLTTALSLTVAAAAALAGAVPVHAQATGERMKVLVPAFPDTAGKESGFGKDVAEEVRKDLESMRTHQPVDKDELKDALKKYDIDEDDLMSCITSRQLAVQIGVELVMCGTVTEGQDDGGQVAASIINPKANESFEIKEFSAADPKQAAQHIIGEFNTYVETLSLAVFCNDYLESQNWSSALENCDKTLQMNPNSKLALYGRATALWKMDRKEEALKAFQKLLEVDPINQNGMLSAGIVASELEQQELASKYFKDYLELNPANAQVRLKIASDIANEGNPAAALQLMEEGMKDSTDISMVEYAGHFAMAAASAKLEAGDSASSAEADPFLEKALGYYERVVAAKGDSVDPRMYTNMLVAYRRLGRSAEAVTLGAKAVQAHPDNAALWSAYADALSDAGRTDEALAALDRIEQIDPSFAGVSARRGAMLLKDGRLDEAVANLKKALAGGEITADQADAFAQTIAATGYNEKAENGQIAEAITYYKTARDLAQSDHTRGMINYMEGYAIYQRAAGVAKAQTFESAKATLDDFQRALQLMNAASAYTEGANNIAQIKKAAQQQIDIQQLLIKRGK